LPVERLGYRTWSGRLRPAVLRWWPITRAGLRLVFARKLIWLFIGIGLFSFLFHFAMVYFVANLKADLVQRGISVPGWVDGFVFTGKGDSYHRFIYLQSVAVMLLLAFAGSILVGNDFRLGSLGFYLARPIGRIHYVVGKLAAAAALAALLTLVPALVLFFEYGAFSDSLDYWRDSQRIFWAIVGYGAMVSVCSAALFLGIAALLERTISILMAWAAVCIFLPMVGTVLRSLSREFGDEIWAFDLIDFWALLRWISSLFFGLRVDRYLERLPYAVVVLGAAVAAALWAFWRRVRAVAVVK
jgi:hypothetical protein